MPDPDQLTISGAPSDLVEALEAERKRRGVTRERLVLDLLAAGLGVAPRPREAGASNGIRDLAGGWTEADMEEFEHAVAIFEEVDEELWR